MPSTDRRLELKAKDIDGSDCLTAGCVCQWVNQLVICLFQMTVRTSNYETFCTHKASNNHLIKVKLCKTLLLMLPVCICIYLKSVLWYIFFNFGYLSSGHYIYMSKDVRIRNYFWSPKGSMGNNIF